MIPTGGRPRDILGNFPLWCVTLVQRGSGLAELQGFVQHFLHFMKHMSLSIITLHELKKSEFENELQLYLYLKVL